MNPDRGYCLYPGFLFFRACTSPQQSRQVGTLQTSKTREWATPKQKASKSPKRQHLKPGSHNVGTQEGTGRCVPCQEEGVLELQQQVVLLPYVPYFRPRNEGGFNRAPQKIHLAHLKVSTLLDSVLKREQPRGSHASQQASGGPFRNNTRLYMRQRQSRLLLARVTRDGHRSFSQYCKGSQHFNADHDPQMC